MSEISAELREFIEVARSGAGNDELERAWIKAFSAEVRSETRSAVRQSILQEVDEFKHQGSASGWTQLEADIALDPRLTREEAAERLCWPISKVERVRKVERPKRRTILRELSAEMNRKEVVA